MKTFFLMGAFLVGAVHAAKPDCTLAHLQELDEKAKSLLAAHTAAVATYSARLDEAIALNRKAKAEILQNRNLASAKAEAKAFGEAINANQAQMRTDHQDILDKRMQLKLFVADHLVPSKPCLDSSDPAVRQTAGILVNLGGKLINNILERPPLEYKPPSRAFPMPKEPAGK